MNATNNTDPDDVPSTRATTPISSAHRGNRHHSPNVSMTVTPVGYGHVRGGSDSCQRLSGRKRKRMSAVERFYPIRHTLFSRFDQGIQLADDEQDDEMWYSVTPEPIARQIASRCKTPNGIIFDAFCGVGGNAIQFAFAGDFVLCCDVVAGRLEMLRNNARVYGQSGGLDLIHADFRTLRLRPGVDGVFLSPPWGGLGISSAAPVYSMGSMDAGNMDGVEIYRLARRISPNIAYYLPRSTSVDDVKRMASLTTNNGVATSPRRLHVDLHVCRDTYISGASGPRDCKSGRSREVVTFDHLAAGDLSPHPPADGHVQVTNNDEWRWKVTAVTCYFGEYARRVCNSGPLTVEDALGDLVRDVVRVVGADVLTRGVGVKMPPVPADSVDSALLANRQVQLLMRQTASRLTHCLPTAPAASSDALPDVSERDANSASAGDDGVRARKRPRVWEALGARLLARRSGMKEAFACFTEVQQRLRMMWRRRRKLRQTKRDLT
ncbi:unnamed protein product [Vitrella brassicaformis CCMP3155]|uniref:Trimethylguanosine synthase n=2 Tax=Vitrella brassicaformis TaxID=1169539 RepID=A0A0G4FES5_VITBC|nr:unnamed protein product [Vitrella brassicaformis CCMP3155]|eukprot:CEM11705.1 unnamed protein product [Vitrella brassicaformis CCMP3155]